MWHCPFISYAVSLEIFPFSNILRRTFCSKHFYLRSFSLVSVQVSKTTGYTTILYTLIFDVLDGFLLVTTSFRACMHLSRTGILILTSSDILFSWLLVAVLIGYRKFSKSRILIATYCQLFFLSRFTRKRRMTKSTVKDSLKE